MIDPREITETAIKAQDIARALGYAFEKFATSQIDAAQFGGALQTIRRLDMSTLTAMLAALEYKVKQMAKVTVCVALAVIGSSLIGCDHKRAASRLLPDGDDKTYCAEHPGACVVKAADSN